MTTDNLGPILTFLGVIGTALIAVWTKRTPEKRDPGTVMGESFQTLAKRLADVEEDSASQWDEIRQLRRKVDSLSSRLRRLIEYALRLEARVTELTGEPHQRPDDLADIFDER